MSTRKRLSGPERREVIERNAADVFAERGYHGASIEEIARRSGISPPVLYDHFASKLDLHKRLLERHFTELQVIWRRHFLIDGPIEERLPRSFDAWFAYVEANPYVARMLFRDTTGDPEAMAIHQQVSAQSRAVVMPFLAQDPGAEHISGGAEGKELEMAWEMVRGVLQGLALWWAEHPDVPRAQLVRTAMNGLWMGFERVRSGEIWVDGIRPASPLVAGRAGWSAFGLIGC